MREILSKITELAGSIWFWPPLAETLLAGEKLKLAHALDYIAKTVTQSRRPTTIQWNGESFTPGQVYKREFSAYGDHVFVPSGGAPTLTLAQKTELRSFLKSDFKWLAQTYEPLLREFGEWRIFMIGGEPVLTLHTHYGGRDHGWYWEIREAGYTLAEMR